ncbi:MAG: hypothetical protein V4671_01000 [Armatimonadota bacterium]
MIWLLSIPALWFLGKKALWLYALDATIKQHRLAKITIYPGDISQFEQMDQRKLEDLTHELQELGFTVLGDLVSELDSAPATPSPTSVETTTKGISRVFGNFENGCYATLTSVVGVTRLAPELNRPPVVETAPFRTVILSLSGNDEDSWGFATHNREIQPFSVLHRHPRQLSHRFIGADARELLTSHLAERDSIAARGNFRWESQTSLAEYLRFEERGLRQNLGHKVLCLLLVRLGGRNDHAIALINHKNK